MLDIGLDGMDIRRIEGAIFNNGSDIDSSMSAWAAGLGPFINFSKPDFFGKAALEAADRQIHYLNEHPQEGKFLGGSPVRSNDIINNETRMVIRVRL